MKRVLFYLILVLCGTVATQQYLLHRRAEKISGLTADIVLLENRKPQTITVSDRQVEIGYSSGKTVAKGKPPEGYVKFDLKKYNQALTEISKLNEALRKAREARKDTAEVTSLLKEKEALVVDLGSFLKVQTHGFVFRPQIGLGWSGKMGPCLAVKVFFWHRYNTGVLVSTELVGLKLSRHLDDLLPLLRNTEGTVGIGLGYGGGLRIWAGGTADL